ncbi:Scr1 family TA system antitoxin-like transcriptional regulator, partial [Streptomyces hydrogenans]
GPKVARGQLEHLLDTSERENITIRVLPFAAGGFPGSGLPTTLFLGRVPQLDTAQFDTPVGASLVDSENHLVNYRAAVERTLGKSLTPQDSRDFIHAIIADE